MRLVFIILIIFIIFLYLLYEYQKRFIEFFNSRLISHNIWLYWENKYGHTKPAYLDLCLDTITKHCGYNFTIHVLNENNIYNFLPHLRKDLDYLLPSIPMKTDYIRYNLLYKYGGIWLDSDTIVIQNLSPLIKKLEKYDFIGFGCHNGNIMCKLTNNGYPKPANWVMVSKKNGKLMKKCIDMANILLNKYNKYYFQKNYHILGRKLIWSQIKYLHKYDKSWKYFHFSSKCIERDNNGIKLTNDRLLSTSIIDPICKSKYFFIPIYNTAPGFPTWFVNMNKNDILKGNILISKLFRYSLM